MDWLGQLLWNMTKLPEKECKEALKELHEYFRQGTEPQSEQPRGNGEGEASHLSESKEPHLNNQ